LTSAPEQYRSRLQQAQAAGTLKDQRFGQLSNARLITGLAALALAGMSIGAGLFSLWWLIAPVAVFITLAIMHDRVDRDRERARRAAAYYDRLLGRVENRWAGKGNPGDEFGGPKNLPGHLYADDLDIFGLGSLFERLASTRTKAGDRTLASWLLGPSEAVLVEARQQAVKELTPKLNLREEIALMGDDVRSAIDDRSMRIWGEQPAVRFFAGARWLALGLALAALLSFVLFIFHVVTLLPFFMVVLAELMFGFAVHNSQDAVVDNVSTAATDLRLLGEFLKRLERENFQSPRLVGIARGLSVHEQRPTVSGENFQASAQLRKLERWVDRLDWTRNQFFKTLAAPLMWTPLCAMAIEAWREQYGSRIGDWVAAVGEFEALCSLAAFAYERPDAVFPELVAAPPPNVSETSGPETNGPAFWGEGVRHPLIGADTSVGNDVELGMTDSAIEKPPDCRLWVISGSNMSGKSTLLRAVGLNAVLAWAGAPVCCARLRISPLTLGASIRVNDSLVDNKSRFYAEISRLRDVVERAKSGTPTLFLLDELLSGTNSHDRRIGAAAVVRGLVERGAIGLVTTHDLALADIAESLGPRARNVHLQDHLEGGEMRFDYQLRPGVVEHSNALALMRAVGLDV
jgi:MutS domain V